MKNSKHIKGLFNAEIITIVGEILAFVGLILTASAGVAVVGATAEEANSLGGFALVTMIVMVVGAILCVIAGIMSLVEVVKLRNVNEGFNNAFGWIICVIILNIVDAFLTNANSTFAGISEIATTLTNVFMIFFICQGCDELVKDAGITALVKKVNIFIIVAALGALVATILSMNNISTEVAEIVSDVCKLVYSIMYLVVLSKTAKICKD